MMETAMLMMTFLLVGGAYGDGVALEYKDLIVNRHNDLRRGEGGSNMNKLTWNSTLGEIAYKWLLRCDLDHGNEFGENLAFQTVPENDDYTAAMNTAMDSWYEEKSRFAPDNCGRTGSCHYSQLVWHSTNQIGCATHICPARSFKVGGNPIPVGKNPKDILFFGCFYHPKGNMKNSKTGLLEPFKVGKPCSVCVLDGQTCEDDLCVGEPKCRDIDENCVRFGADGNCEKNPVWMKENCKQTCKVCTGGDKPECKDLNKMCKQWIPDKLTKEQKNKSCDTSFMRQDCAKTCGFCD